MNTSPDQLSEYRTNGFLILRSVFSQEEVALLIDEQERAIADLDQRMVKNGQDNAFNLRYEQIVVDGKHVPWKVDPFHDLSPHFNALIRDTRITDPLTCIYNGYAPRLFKDKFIIKPPGSHGNGLHQDYNWWQGFPSESLLSVSIALDDTNRKNGCTQMWKGYHDTFRHVEGKQDDVAKPDELKDEDKVYVELNAGDVAIFRCLTPHAADGNTSDSTRRVIFLSYNDSRDGELYNAHYDHFFWYRTVRMSDDERPKYFIF